ncbi:MAG: hypothetical protein AMXMBFR7_46020 [Planctomycetota bacterium]
MGRVFKPKYAWTKADGTRVEKVTEAWYIEFGDASGRWIRRKAGVSKEQAQDALRKAESDVLAEKNGLPVQRFAEMLCESLVKDYLTARAPHVSAKQAVIVGQRLRDMLRLTKAVYLRQLSPEAVEGALQELANEKNLSARSQNGYLQAVKGMLNWAVSVRRIPYNPLDCIPNRPDLEKKRLRRALSEEEIATLLQVALTGPYRRKVHVYQNRPQKDGAFKDPDIPLPVQAHLAQEGRRMALAYRLMLETGLRKGEVRALAWGDLDLEAGTLTTRPEWVGNKNGKRQTLPLAPGLAEALKAWREEKKPEEKDPVVGISDRALRCFDDDLNCAQIPKKDAAGRVVDLHALRHTYGTRLIAAGVDIKTVQALMRHSSPELTLGIYVHADKDRMREAVKRLPKFSIVPDVKDSPSDSTPDIA